MAFQDRHVVNFFEIFECVVLWMVDENIVRTNYERMNGVISFFFLLFDVQSNAASQSISWVEWYWCWQRRRGSHVIIWAAVTTKNTRVSSDSNKTEFFFTYFIKTTLSAGKWYIQNTNSQALLEFNYLILCSSIICVLEWGGKKCPSYEFISFLSAG